MGKKVTIKKNRPDVANIYNTIKIESQLFRVRQDIGKLRLGILIAENVQRPQRYQLYQAYIDSMLDAHLTACINNRINFTLAREHQFLNADGSVNEEATKLLQTKWYRDLVRYALESIFWGYSVVQLGDLVENGFTSCNLIPRIYVKPEFGLVTENYGSFTGNSYKEEPYKWWCLGIGNEKDLGMLKQASIYAIYKKNALGAWAEFCEVFGVPLRVGTTDLTDPLSRQNMENQLKNMGVSSYVLKGKNDLIELKETSRPDAHSVFNEMVERTNSEMSKLILGATGIMDEKAHVGAAKVHQDIADNILLSDEHLIENLVNSELKERLAYHGFPVGELTFKISDVEDIDLKDRAEISVNLLKTGKYTIPAEYIEKTFGIPCEVVEAPKELPSKPFAENLLNELSNLYP